MHVESMLTRCDKKLYVANSLVGPLVWVMDFEFDMNLNPTNERLQGRTRNAMPSRQKTKNSKQPAAASGRMSLGEIALKITQIIITPKQPTAIQPATWGQPPPPLPPTAKK